MHSTKDCPAPLRRSYSALNSTTATLRPCQVFTEISFKSTQQTITMKRRSMAKSKYSHVEKVAAFFGQLQQAAPATSNWVADLERRALNKQAGWKADADSYLHGLATARALSADAAEACRERLAQCQESDRGLREVVLPIAWIAVVAAMAVTCRVLSVDTLMLSALLLLTAFAGGVWASKQSWRKRWKRPIVVGMALVVAPALTYCISWGVGEAMQSVSIEQFKIARSAFMTDPHGFPMLRKLAHEQYGIEVVLGNAEESWANTTLSLPDASVAWAMLQPGYCVLSLNRSSVLGGFGPVGQVNPTLWVQGVMLHEFAHCLDISRDMPAFGQRAIGTRSVAPVNASGVRGIDSLIEAGTMPTTQLWREAVADIMAIGFWKITAPSSAHDLATSLRQKRVDNYQDTKHATMCWIDFADQTVPPLSTADLFEWADKLRSQAPCKLSAYPKLTHGQQLLKVLSSWYASRSFRLADMR